MEKRICRYCNRERPVKEFEVTKVIKRKEYRRWRCHSCYMASKKDRLIKIREWFEGLKTSMRCSQCGNDDIRVMEFHHTGPDKEVCIAIAVSRGFSKKKILKEIAKCDVLCANCHRILHYDERRKNRRDEVQTGARRSGGPEGAGSTPAVPTILKRACSSVVEHCADNARVAGPIPATPTSNDEGERLCDSWFMTGRMVQRNS